MYVCSICATAIWKARDVYKGKIGQPEIQIGELFTECTQLELKCDGICKECYGKLLQYQAAAQIIGRVRDELLALLQQTDQGNVIESDCEYELEQLIEEDNDAEDALTEAVDVGNEDVVEVELDDGLQEQDEFIVEPKEVVIQMFDDDCVEAVVHSTEDDIKADCIELQIEDHQSSIDEAFIKYTITDGGKEHNIEEEQSDVPDNSTDAVQLDDEGYIIQKDLNLINDSNFPPKCEECGEPFKNKRAYRAHMKRQHFAGFICEQCGKTLYTRSGLITHLQNHKDVMEFVCSECNQRFKNKFALKHHQAWHTGLKPYQCDVCSKQFVHYLGLYRHKKIHDDSSRCIKCEVCGYKFRTNAHLRRHMITHTGAKPHSCPICGKCFTQSYNLKVHVKEHQAPGSTRQRRLKCKKCSRTFRNKENYHDHCEQNACLPPTK